LHNFLKIGTTEDNYLKNITKLFEFEFEKRQIKLTSNIVIIDNSIVDNPYYLLHKAVIDGHIDAFAYPLDQCPILDENDSLCISAISNRTYAGEGILFNSKLDSPKSIHDLQNSYKILVFSERQLKQMEAIFPNCNFVMSRELNFSELITTISNNFDGAIISGMYYHLNFKEDPEFSYIPVHPSELVTAPGQGVIAYICHKENFITRTLLNKIHERKMVQVVNNERIVLKTAGKDYRNKIGIYCYTDNRNNFHILGFLTDPETRYRFSQNVCHGLGLKVCDAFFPKKHIT
jgi:porphobilinogen deaminase